MKTEDKIQTGLRIPIKRYNELSELADEMGVSVNSLVLMLIDLGLAVRNGTINPVLAEKLPREQSHTRQDTVAKHTR